ncbi:hypothetical protein AXF42_Ash011598 [Apostasia shenzhenica]|uniref:Uncharacterized protein n=1 Tax=Apostasia shenzhenica TaxID=1088818 RepID=A0A2I0BB30_9ASPA|nr:hypothetical protein AXF42_Ash011598 [Apostasia shenzhenica]
MDCSGGESAVPLASADPPRDYIEHVGDSEEISCSGAEETGDEGCEADDAESCIIGGAGDRDQGCISWRMWCILGHETWGGGRWRGSCGGDGRSNSDSSALTVDDEAEENRLFWEACLADESPLPPSF